jgi:aryl-alcohol dehydrogenase-like predicted oxidoreductase
LKRCWDAGVNFFDTAEGYGGGLAETILGNHIKKLNPDRADIVISTKIFFGGHEKN